MKKSLLFFLLAVSGAVLAAPQLARRTDSAALDDFLARKAALQEARRQVLMDLQIAGNYQHSYNCLTPARLRAPAGKDAYSQRQKTQLHNSLRIDVAQLMTSSQYVIPENCDSSQFRAISSAAHDYLKARVSVGTLATLSDSIAIAVAVPSTSRTSTVDGYKSSQRLQIVESLSGPYRAGQRLQLRQESGPVAGGGRVQLSSEPQLEIGQRYLVFLSRQQYLISVKQRAGTILPDDSFEPGLIAITEPDQLLPSDTSHHWGSRKQYAQAVRIALEAKR